MSAAVMDAKAPAVATIMKGRTRTETCEPGELRFGAARQVLTSALGQARGLTGPAAERLLPVTYGKLGECCFQLGDVAAALDPTTTALRLCEQQRDLEGILA
jgi:hypothetical protein